MKNIILSLTTLCLLFGFSTKVNNDITPQFKTTTAEAFNNISEQLTPEEVKYFSILITQKIPTSFLNKPHNYLFYTHSVDIRDTSFDEEFDYFDTKESCAARIEQYQNLPLKAPKQEAIAYRRGNISKKDSRKKTINQYANRYALLYFIDHSGEEVKITLKFETPNGKIKIKEYRTL